jgi:polyadenylate-binding protein
MQTQSTPQVNAQQQAAAQAAFLQQQQQQQGAQANLQPGFTQNNASLYVGDLAPAVNEAKLFEVFNAVGPVASIRICRDAVTRRSRGYGYVNFHNPADAERALDTMNYQNIDGRPCRLMWKQSDKNLRISGAGNIFVKNLDESIDNKQLYDTFSLFGNILSCKVATDRESGKSKGYGFVHYERTESAEKATKSVNGMTIAGKEVVVTKFKPRNQRQTLVAWTNIYMKNIPNDWKEENLTKMFDGLGEITSLKLAEAADGKPTTFAFVNLASHEEAKKAVEQLNGFKVGEKEDGGELLLEVTRAQKKSERQKILSQQFAKQKMDRINKYQGLNLYVKNIDDSIDDAKLNQHFQRFGTITSARVMQTESGESRGFGFVCFNDAAEATKAVTEMNGKMLAGKPLYVALAQRKETRQQQLAQAHNARGMGRGGPMMFPGMMPGMMMMQPGGARPMFPMGMQGGPMSMYPRPMFNQMQQQRVARGPRGPQQQRVKFNQNARNMANAPRAPQSNGGPQPPQQSMQQPQQPPPLTASALADAPAERRKNMIGERIYPLIHQLQPQLAGKITGMLLEFENSELLNLLESPPDLKKRVNEAIEVLNAHQKSGKSQAAIPR